MADNRFKSINEYEQLKRKNRRRLVGASVMVVLAGLLLGKTLSSGKDQQAAQNINVTDLPASGAKKTPSTKVKSTESQPAMKAASNDHAPDLAPGAVLEPAPVDGSASTAKSGHSEELANPLAASHIKKEEITKRPSEKSATTVKPVSPKAPAPAVKAESKLVEAPTPIVVIDNSNAKARAAEAVRQAAEARKAAEEKRTAVAQQAKAKVEAQSKAQTHAAQLKAEQLKAEQLKAQKAKVAQEEATRKANATKREAAARVAAQKSAAAKAEKLKKQQAANQREARNALNNKDAGEVKVDPKAILEGKSLAGKALIQAGAYSDHAQAQKAQQQLANAGVSAYISEVQTSKGTIYRVRTGGYASRAAAADVLSKMRKHGLDGIVIGQ